MATPGPTTNNVDGVAGVHWDAGIVPVRVLGDNGSGSFVEIIAGIIWAAGNPENEPDPPPNPNPGRVINLSLGGNIGEPCPGSLDFLFGQLTTHGAILVAAAGNDNIDAVHTFPALCGNVVTVGATGPSNGRAPYAAWQDPDRDLLVDEGEPFGFFPDPVAIAPGEVRSDIRVIMEPLTVTASNGAMDRMGRLISVR